MPEGPAVPVIPSTGGRAHTIAALPGAPARVRSQRLSRALALASPLLLAGSLVAMLSGLSPASAGTAVRATTAVAAVSIPAPHVVPTTTTAPPPPPTTTTTTSTTTTTTAPPPPPTTTTAPPPPAPASSSAVPPEGEATAYGCGPALAYLAAYAAPGFQLVCPGDSQGHQATTCISSYPCAPGQKMIIITVPCPAAYMNEAHNSWAIQDGGTIDPYGYCH